MVRFVFLYFVLIGAGYAESAKVRPENWAEQVIGSPLGNFYRVSEDLFRSEQPKPPDIPTV